MIHALTAFISASVRAFLNIFKSCHNHTITHMADIFHQISDPDHKKPEWWAHKTVADKMGRAKWYTDKMVLIGQMHPV